MTPLSISETETQSATRIFRAIVGVGMTMPLVASMALEAWVAFGLAIAGTCMVTSALIGKTTVESLALCAVAIVAMVATLAGTGNILNPASIAVISIASIAAVATGLLGIELPKGSQKLTIVEQQKHEVQKVSDSFREAANQNNIAA